VFEVGILLHFEDKNREARKYETLKFFGG
jgi:hypothetical protein